MKRSRLISFLFTLCLILCACASEQTPPALDVQPPVTDNTQQQPPSSNETPAPPQTDAENEDIVQPPYIPEALTVELVVEWEAADALLSRLEDMGELLRLALEKTGYGVERITLTISTAATISATMRAVFMMHDLRRFPVAQGSPPQPAFLPLWEQ